MNILAMMEGETLLYTLNGGGWFQWPDGAMASPAIAGAEYGDYHLALVVPPSLTLEEAKAAKLATLADKRWSAETGGVVVAGAPVKTDRESSSILTSAYVLAKDDPEYIVTNWKVDQGVFITLDANTIIALSTAVRTHVQACFDREAVLSALILAAADQTELDAIDIDTGWPTN